MTGRVYFARAVGLDYVKIGFTSDDPIKRVRSLQTGCPERLELVGSFPGTMADERELHRVFGWLRGNGEWFAERYVLGNFLSAERWTMMIMGEALEAHRAKWPRGLWVNVHGETIRRRFRDRQLIDCLVRGRRKLAEIERRLDRDFGGWV